MKIRIGNVTINTTDNDQSGDDIRDAIESNGGAINGGHFGGENHGITGGTFHGAIHISSDTGQ
ncbi:hypothetical protein OHA19_23905 [Streptomyces sp. NBC_00012]|uniref:hypothetical protein n=1 Tax=Streptomyces sp. NBC_00012 TaxID=2975621 RepID=UPI00325128E2